MTISRKLSAILILVACFCGRVASQTPAPIGIRPQPPEGKGVVVLKAARLVDGTGAAPIVKGNAAEVPPPGEGENTVTWPVLIVARSFAESVAFNCDALT